MSHWNYRLLADPDRLSDSGLSYQIIEAYYDEAGVPWGWASAEPAGDAPDELRDVLGLMSEAFDHPPLTRRDFVGRSPLDKLEVESKGAEDV